VSLVTGLATAAASLLFFSLTACLLFLRTGGLTGLAATFSMAEAVLADAVGALAYLLLHVAFARIGAAAVLILSAALLALGHFEGGFDSSRVNWTDD